MYAMQTTIAVVSAAILFSIPFVTARARPLEPNDYLFAETLQYKGVTAAFSPDGRQIATTIVDPRRIKAGSPDAAPGGSLGSQGADIWLYETSTGKRRNLTQSQGNNWGPTWSPDGTRLIFISDRDGKPHLWIWSKASAEQRKISNAQVATFHGYQAPIWLADGRHVIVNVLSPQAISTGRTLTKQGQTSFNLFDFGEAETVGDPNVTARVYVSPPTRAEISLASNLLDVMMIDVSSGASTTLANAVNGIGAGLRVAPNGRHLAYLSMTQRTTWGGSCFDLYVVDIASRARRTLATGVCQFGNGALTWSPDSLKIAYFAEGSRLQQAPRPASWAAGTPDEYDTSGLFVVMVNDGRVVAFRGAPDGGLFSSRHYYAPLWSGDSGAVFAFGHGDVWRGAVSDGSLHRLTQNEGQDVIWLPRTSASRNQAWMVNGGRSLVAMVQDARTLDTGFARVDVASGALTMLTHESRSYSGVRHEPTVAPDGRSVAFVAQSASEPDDLWLADAGFTSTRRLTALNPVLGTLQLGRTQLIDYVDQHGAPRRAALLVPPDFQPGRRYPTVVWVYPSAMGSRSAKTFGLTGLSAFNMQMLATRGYAVLAPDIPIRIGEPLDSLVEGTTAAIDGAVALGVADPERLVVMGQSGGGFAALALATQSDRFRAAIINSGHSNPSGMYSVWHVWERELGGGMGGAPWEVPDTYFKNSPIFRLGAIRVPLLVEAGAMDYGTIEHSDDLFANLQHAGKEAIYLRYDGESHVLETPANVAHYWASVLAFLQKNLRR